MSNKNLVRVSVSLNSERLQSVEVPKNRLDDFMKLVALVGRSLQSSEGRARKSRRVIKDDWQKALTIANFFNAELRLSKAFMQKHCPHEKLQEVTDSFREGNMSSPIDCTYKVCCRCGATVKRLETSSTSTWVDV